MVARVSEYMTHYAVRRDVIGEMRLGDQKRGISNRYYEWQEIHDRVMWKKGGNWIQLRKRRNPRT